MYAFTWSYITIFTGRKYLNLIEHIIVESDFQQAVGFTLIHSGNVYEDGSYRFGFFDDRAQVDQSVVELEKGEIFKGFISCFCFKDDDLVSILEDKIDLQIEIQDTGLIFYFLTTHQYKRC